ncbi:MAG: HAD-IA family hydrolase [Candidatus Omnitrophota bacterium]
MKQVLMIIAIICFCWSQTIWAIEVDGYSLRPIATSLAPNETIPQPGAESSLSHLEHLIPYLTSEKADTRTEATAIVRAAVAKIKNVKAIAFDFAGVVSLDGISVTLRTLKDRLGIDYDKLEDVFFGSEYFEWTAGKLTKDEFWQKIRDRLRNEQHVDLFGFMPKDEIEKLWFGAYVIMPGMVELIRNLKDRGYKVILFTNNAKEKFGYAMEKYRLDDLFDCILNTADINCTKKDKESYEKLVEKSGVQPEEILFVDDKKVFFEHPNNMGILTLEYSCMISCVPLKDNSVIAELLNGKISGLISQGDYRRIAESIGAAA